MRKVALASLVAAFCLVPAAQAGALAPPELGGFTITTTISGNGAEAAAGTQFTVHYLIDNITLETVQPLMQNGDSFSLGDLPIGTDVYITANLPSSTPDLYWDSVSVNGARSVTFTIADATPVDVQVNFTALLMIGQVQLDVLTDGIDREALPPGAAFTFEWTAADQTGTADVSSATGWTWLSPEFPIGTEVIIGEVIADRTAADLPPGWEWVGDPVFSPGDITATVAIGFGTSPVTATNRAAAIAVVPPVAEPPALPRTGQVPGSLVAAGISALLIGALALLLDARRPRVHERGPGY